MPERSSPDRSTTETYLSTLFGTAAAGFLPVWTADTRQTARFPVSQLSQAANCITTQSAKGCNVYVGMGLQGSNLGSRRRGGASSVVAIAGAWDDLDIAGPAHSRIALPSNRGAALALLAEFPLHHSLLVDSGHGLYPLWLFKEVWVFDGDVERLQAVSLVARLQQTNRRTARKYGYGLETTSDLARVLRPVGALNCKPGLPPVPVRLVEDTGARYSVEDVEAVLPDEQLAPPTSRPRTGTATPSADLDRILAGCAFLRRCRDDAADLDEPAWHAMISIVARCRNGALRVHALSEPFLRYDRAETDRKFAYALAANRPLRCETIRRDRGGEPEGARCPHAGRIGSPVVLGYPRIAVPRIRQRAGVRLVRLAPREGVVRVG